VCGDISGSGFGAFAEYVCARENSLTIKPASLTFEEAASVPHAALLALQGLREKRQVRPGDKVLVNGAGGGTGTFAVQIAKSFGAEVTGVDSSRKLDMLRSIGADHVIDYMQEDFTKAGQLYDLILDVVTYHSIFDYKRVLSGNGCYVMLGGGSWRRVFQAMFLAPLISRTGNKTMSLLMHKANKGMTYMKELLGAGKVKPIIDRSYPLHEVPEALRYFDTGNAQGKIVVTVGETS
jgi:NADPH:quinone reductase-like Zn-dependent oxidoreductase